MINSFDSQSDFDEDYWIMDLTGDDEIGYANYSESSINHDGLGAIRFDYSAHNSEIWGGFTKLSHFHPNPESVYNLSDYNTISFWYYNESPASQEDRMDLRFVLYDISTSDDNNVYSESQVEYFYSFHFDMLDQEAGWNKVEIPLVGTSIPDQALPYNFGFNNTGWNGISGDGTLDLDSIKGFAIEFFVNNEGLSGDSVQGTIILDELKVENTEIVEPETVTVTFQVDMSSQNINPACSPGVAGNFNGWGWLEALSDDDGDNIWETDIIVNSGVTYEYLFSSCGWDNLEELDFESDCTNGNSQYTNRVLNPVSQNTVVEPVCFGTCDAECPQSELVNVTFQVDTNNNANGYDEQLDMFLIGSFQTPFPWDIDLFPINLEDSNSDGIWNTTISILSGTYIEYKFANGEGSDALIENNIDNCSNNGNRFLTVPYEDIILDATYFNSCNSEGSVTVTFQVDMSNEAVGGGDGLCGVHVGGTFNYFDWWANELSDNNNDNVWETDIVLESGSSIEYKFANCGSFGIETVPDDCGFGEDQNRSFTVPDEDATINVVCFGSCSQQCGALSYSNVTFSVNMSEIETADTGVFASGPGVLMGPSGIELYDEDNDDIWSGSASIPYGEYYYKFRNGYYPEWDSDGWEEIEGVCSYGEFSDRILIVDQPTLNLETVCFGSCETCEACEEANGDINQDSFTDVLDIVIFVNSIVMQNPFTSYEICSGDVNLDGVVNVLDVVVIINMIIE